MLTVRSTINFASQTVPPIIPVVQGDPGRAILFTLADFTIPAGATATYYVQKPSGEAVYNNATIDGNNVLVNLTAQSIIEKGDNYGQVRIAVGEDVVTSFDFILLVKEFRGIDAVQSLTEMNIFDKAVEQASEAIDEVKTDALEAIDDAKDEAIEEVTSNFDLKLDASSTKGVQNQVITQAINTVNNAIGDLSGETVTPTATNNYGVGGNVGQVIETWATTEYWHGIYTVSAGNTYGITTVSDFPQQLVVWFTNASNTIIENHKAFATDHVEMVCTAPTGATKLYVMSYGYDAYHGTVQKVEPLSETVSNLKEDFSGFKTDVFEEKITPSANLFPSQILTEGTLWNCWTATVYTESNNNYACFEFSIPEGADYISANYQWAENSFSAFVDDNYAKLDLIKNTKQSGGGYIYAIPQGTTKACVSFNNTPGGHHDKYVNDGIVFIVGNSNITDKTIDDYAETKEYFADNLKLASENNEAIPTVVNNLDSKIDTISDLFTIAKNLFTGINVGKIAVAWNIGDIVTFTDNANYAYGVADVEGCIKVTVNMSSVSDAYSFFTDADHKKVATSADNRIGTTRVYNVPTGAKYFYISSSNISVWSVYGLVAFSGDSDIATNPVSAEVYPYNVEMYFADGLKLSTGGTIGGKLENTGMVFHVEKDGSGDFTSFVEAIQEATKYMDSVVYVGAGEWDIIDEFGSTYMESVTSDPTTWGLVLKNRVHVVGTAKTIITAKYTGTTENTRQYFSAFNAGAYGFTLENLEIEADNIRYVMHDDRGNGGQTPYTNRYINVSMKLTHGYYGDTALGGGLGVNGTFEIINCRFEGSPDTHRLAYYHGNNYGGETGAKCKIIVQGCYFADNGSFDVTKYGDSTEMTTAYLSNNSFGSAPQVTSGSYAPQDNMQIVAWCNEIRNAS